MNVADRVNSNREENSYFNRGDTAVHPNHASSNWWVRLNEGEISSSNVADGSENPNTAEDNDVDGNGHDENVIEAGGNESRNTIRPANRRSHSATVYKQHNLLCDQEVKEWMIISGGFTDTDWNSFPVWAFDLGYHAHVGDAVSEGGLRGPWIDFTGVNLGTDFAPEPSFSTSTSTSSTTNNKNSTTASSMYQSPTPQGRVGHLSSIHNDCLYIFGGLTYSLGSFHVENDGEEEGGDGDTLIVWRACGLNDMFWGKEGTGTGGEGVLKWERIVPRVDTNAVMTQHTTSSGDNADGSNDSGEDSIVGDDEAEGHGTIRRWQRRASYSSTTSNATIDPSVTLPRGEAQGGQYSSNNGIATDDCFIFYGGMYHHRSSAIGNSGISSNVELPTGDVWKYEYETETLRLLAPYPPLEWQRDGRSGTYPVARTAHAGTIVGDELIIHGGLGLHEDTTQSSSFSSPSSSYPTYRTSPSWQALGDTWVFDLKTLTWRERIQFPQLKRSYHSLVGHYDGTVAVFGGFQQDQSIGGETVAFVFKDLIVSRANETHWLKLQPPSDQPPAMGWRTAHYSSTLPFGITNRLEHSAILDRFGSMYVWGGRFQSVRQISGLWRLDLFNEDSNLRFEIATS